MDPAKRRVPISIEELIEKKEQEKNAANKVRGVQSVQLRHVTYFMHR